MCVFVCVAVCVCVCLPNEIRRSCQDLKKINCFATLRKQRPNLIKWAVDKEKQEIEKDSSSEPDEKLHDPGENAPDIINKELN